MRNLFQVALVFNLLAVGCGKTVPETTQTPTPAPVTSPAPVPSPTPNPAPTPAPATEPAPAKITKSETPVAKAKGDEPPVAPSPAVSKPVAPATTLLFDRPKPSEQTTYEDIESGHYKLNEMVIWKKFPAGEMLLRYELPNPAQVEDTQPQTMSFQQLGTLPSDYKASQLEFTIHSGLQNENWGSGRKGAVGDRESYYALIGNYHKDSAKIYFVRSFGEFRPSGKNAVDIISDMIELQTTEHYGHLARVDGKLVTTRMFLNRIPDSKKYTITYEIEDKKQITFRAKFIYSHE